MVRIKAFGIAIVLSIISVVAFLFFYIPYINSYYKVTDNSIRYGISQEKYKSVDIIKENLDKNLPNNTAKKNEEENVEETIKPLGTVLEKEEDKGE